MARFRFSIRGLMIVMVVVGFDAAVMARALRRGQQVHDATTYTVGFGAVLLVWNLLVFSLYLYYAKRGNLPRETRLNSTPPPLVMFAFYGVVLTFAILSVLFFTSGRF